MVFRFQRKIYIISLYGEFPSHNKIANNLLIANILFVVETHIIEFFIFVYISAKIWHIWDNISLENMMESMRGNCFRSADYYFIYAFSVLIKILSQRNQTVYYYIFD